MTIFTDVACTACGCVCDDLRVTAEEGRITKIEPPCPLAERWFLRAGLDDPTPAYIEDRAAAPTAAIEAAAELLRTARSPLIYGLSNSSSHGQRAAVRLADRLGATIDTTASTCHGPSIIALQQVGESTCTLGEIRQRADLVVYWGSDPLESHPRHLGRYVREAGRTLVVIDPRATDTSVAADLFLQPQAGGDFDILWALRGLVAGFTPAASIIGGINREALVDFVARMKSCQCGVFFFGRGLARGATGHATIEALLALTRDLNAFTRFHARRMRVYGDVAGADTVLCWQTGYPFSVNLARGYPRYNPGEYSANETLARGEADCCVLVGTEGVGTLSPSARSALASLPTIVLEKAGVKPQLPGNIRFTTAVNGIQAEGTAYRMDEVPIPLRRLVPSVLPTDDEILSRILAAL